jgi:hypothetical protein
MSASGLHAGETVDPGRHVAIVAGVGLQFQEYGQRPRRFAGAVGGAEVVEELASASGVGAGASAAAQTTRWPAPARRGVHAPGRPAA